MKITLIEKFLKIVANLSLLGMLFSALIAKGTLESDTEMCFPLALVQFVGGSFVSLVTWAALTLLVDISRRLKV